MKQEIVPTSGMQRGQALSEQLIAASKGSDLRLALFSGVAGTGKTSCARAIAQQHRSVYIRAQRIWGTAGSAGPLVLNMLEAVMEYRFGAGVQSAYRHLIRELPAAGISLVIIDEADYLISRVRTFNCPILDVCRDIADQTGVPFLFISINNLAQRLTNPSPFLEAISSRLIGHAEFTRLSPGDAAKLATLIEGVRLDRSLISLLLRASKGSIRPLLNLYSQIETAAKKARISGDVDLECVRKFGLIEFSDDSLTVTQRTEQKPSITGEPATATIDSEAKVA